jgi:hypothetical protein
MKRWVFLLAFFLSFLLTIFLFAPENLMAHSQPAQPLKKVSLNTSFSFRAKDSCFDEQIIVRYNKAAFERHTLGSFFKRYEVRSLIERLLEERPHLENVRVSINQISFFY